MTGRPVILGAEQPGQSLGPEWFHAQCEGAEQLVDGRPEHVDCDRAWDATGTLASRQAAARAQRHADRTGHRVAAEWANRR